MHTVSCTEYEIEENIPEHISRSYASEYASTSNFVSTYLFLFIIIILLLLTENCFSICCNFHIKLLKTGFQVENNNNVHDYCLTENSEQPSTPKMSEVGAEIKKTPNGGVSRNRRITKSARLQYSLKNNEKFLKLSEENINSEKEYKQRKLLLLENNLLQKSKYYERKAVAFETIANASKQIAVNLQDIKNSMIQNQNQNDV